MRVVSLKGDGLHKYPRWREGGGGCCSPRNWAITSGLICHTHFTQCIHYQSAWKWWVHMWDRDTETKCSTGFFPPLCDLCFTAVSCFQLQSLTLLSTFYSSNIPQLSTSFRTGALCSYRMTFGGHISIQLQRAEQQHLQCWWWSSPATYNWVITLYAHIMYQCSPALNSILWGEEFEPDWWGFLTGWYQKKIMRDVMISNIRSRLFLAFSNWSTIYILAALLNPSVVLAVTEQKLLLNTCVSASPSTRPTSIS